MIMESNLVSPENIPFDFNSPHRVLKMLIDAINMKLTNDIERKYPGVFNNPDGTFDRFRCVIEFDENETEHIYWHYYHEKIMAAYEQVGWTVHRGWFHGDKYAYCLALPQIPVDEALNDLKGEIKRP